MTQRKVRTGVIGCGKVGHFHADCYAKSPLSEFAGVYSRNYEKAAAFAAQYGVKAYHSSRKWLPTVLRPFLSARRIRSIGALPSRRRSEGCTC